MIEQVIGYEILRNPKLISPDEQFYSDYNIAGEKFYYGIDRDVLSLFLQDYLLKKMPAEFTQIIKKIPNYATGFSLLN